MKKGEVEHVKRQECLESREGREGKGKEQGVKKKEKKIEGGGEGGGTKW